MPNSVTCHDCGASYNPEYPCRCHWDAKDRMLHDIGDADWRVEAMIEAEQAIYLPSGDI